MTLNQLAHGDVHAWFQNILAFPLREFLDAPEAEDLIGKIIPALSEKAAAHSDILQAQSAMVSGFEEEFLPQVEKADVYEKLYRRYVELGAFVESHV